MAHALSRDVIADTSHTNDEFSQVSEPLVRFLQEKSLSLNNSHLVRLREIKGLVDKIHSEIQQQQHHHTMEQSTVVSQRSVPRAEERAFSIRSSKVKSQKQGESISDHSNSDCESATASSVVSGRRPFNITTTFDSKHDSIKGDVSFASHGSTGFADPKTRTNRKVSSISTGTVTINTLCSGAGGSPSSGKTAKNRSNRTRKKRALIAVTPCKELTEEESSTTVAMKIFGPLFVKWWFKWKRLSRLLNLIAWTVSTVAYVLFPLNSPVWNAGVYVFSPLHWIALILLTIQCLSLVNASAVKRCILTFNGGLLFVEGVLFGLSFWSLYCFTWSSLAIAYTNYVLLLLFIFYDGYSLHVRQKLRPFLIYSAIGFVCYLVLLYSRMMQHEMCYYRVNIFRGLLIDDGRPQPTAAVAADDSTGTTNGATPSGRQGWTFSVFDFCLNRGITLLALILRILYLSHKHPEDCTIITSRVRLTETAIIGTRNGSVSQPRLLQSGSDSSLSYPKALWGAASSSIVQPSSSEERSPPSSP